MIGRVRCVSTCTWAASVWLAACGASTCTWASTRGGVHRRPRGWRGAVPAATPYSGGAAHAPPEPASPLRRSRWADRQRLLRLGRRRPSAPGAGCGVRAARGPQSAEPVSAPRRGGLGSPRAGPPTAVCAAPGARSPRAGPRAPASLRRPLPGSRRGGLAFITQRVCDAPRAAPRSAGHATRRFSAWTEMTADVSS